MLTSELDIEKALEKYYLGKIKDLSENEKIFFSLKYNDSNEILEMKAEEKNTNKFIPLFCYGVNQISNIINEKDLFLIKKNEDDQLSVEIKKRKEKDEETLFSMILCYMDYFIDDYIENYKKDKIYDNDNEIIVIPLNDLHKEILNTFNVKPELEEKIINKVDEVVKEKNNNLDQRKKYIDKNNINIKKYTYKI